jgi:hypothetical protein
LPKKLGPELILVPLRMLLSLGEIILFSPNFWGVDDALKAVGPLKGKTVVDVTNPLEWNPNDRLVRSLPWSTTAAEELAKKTSRCSGRQSLQHDPCVLYSPRSFQTRVPDLLPVQWLTAR